MVKIFLIAEQRQLEGLRAFTLEQIKIADKQFGGLLSGVVPLHHTVNTGKIKDLKILVFLPHPFAVVVRKQKLALHGGQRMAESLMIFQRKAFIVDILTFHIWRIAVKDCVRAVIMSDELLEILILNNHI